jgi:aminopeptidase N
MASEEGGAAVQYYLRFDLRLDEPECPYRGEVRMEFGVPHQGEGVREVELNCRGLNVRSAHVGQTHTACDLPVAEIEDHPDQETIAFRFSSTLLIMSLIIIILMSIIEGVNEYR